jgi:3-oxoadipate enol-lactonase
MTLVFLHPVGLDHDCWQLTGLQGQMPDYPGHGNRPLPPPEDFTLEAIADEIAGTYDGLLDLVGVSMGASVAAYIAVRHPDRVRSMVMAAGNAGRPKGESPEVTEMQRQRAADQVRLGMAGTLESTLKRWFTQAALDQPNHPGVEYVRQRWLADDPNAVAATWLCLGKAAVRDEMPHIRLPITVLGGRHDVAATPAALTGLQALLPNSRLAFIDGPHMLPLENPREFADAVHQHLEWVASSEPAGGRS